MKQKLIVNEIFSNNSIVMNHKRRNIAYKSETNLSLWIDCISYSFSLFNDGKTQQFSRILLSHFSKRLSFDSQFGDSPKSQVNRNYFFTQKSRIHHYFHYLIFHCLSLFFTINLLAFLFNNQPLILPIPHSLRL